MEDILSDLEVLKFDESPEYLVAIEAQRKEVLDKIPAQAMKKSKRPAANLPTALQTERGAEISNKVQHVEPKQKKNTLGPLIEMGLG